MHAYWESQQDTMGPKMITHTFFKFGNEFPNYTEHLLHRAFWQEVFCVIRGLHKVLSVNAPITHINYLEINFPLTRTCVTLQIICESFRVSQCLENLSIRFVSVCIPTLPHCHQRTVFWCSSWPKGFRLKFKKHRFSSGLQCRPFLSARDCICESICVCGGTATKG